MLTKFLLLTLIQLYIFQITFAVYYGHEVGHTSMDSTHYDRRILLQQCPIIKVSHPATYLFNFKSPSLFSINNTNASDIVLSRKQIIMNYEEDTLVTRSTSDTININNTVPLTMDQAALDIIIDKQVFIINFFVHSFHLTLYHNLD